MIEHVFYSGMPEAEYFAVPALNSSLLKLMGRSPAHCRAAAEQGSKETPALAAGKMIHCAVLEPDRLDAAYCLAPDPADYPDALTDHASYKEAAKALGLKVSGSKGDLKTRIQEAAPDTVFWEDFAPAAVGDRIPLSMDDAIMALQITRAIAASPRARKALSGGDAELSYFWRDRMTGLNCKARADYYREDLGLIVDVKTTQDARPEAVARDIHKYGYHISAAHYMSGLRELGQPCHGFAWVFVEKTAPYGIGLYFAGADMLSTGDRLATRYRREYADCQASGNWPGYSLEFQTIELPAWADNSSENEEA